MTIKKFTDTDGSKQTDEPTIEHQLKRRKIVVKDPFSKLSAVKVERKDSDDDMK